MLNRFPVLTMAAGHLHHDEFSRHQRTKEVAVPKLADPIEGRSEPSAKSWMRTTNENRYHVDCPRRHVDINERLMGTERLRIDASPSRVDCPMKMGDHCPQEHRSLSAQIRQEP